MKNRQIEGCPLFSLSTVLYCLLNNVYHTVASFIESEFRVLHFVFSLIQPASYLKSS